MSFLWKLKPSALDIKVKQFNQNKMIKPAVLILMLMLVPFGLKFIRELKAAVLIGLGNVHIHWSSVSLTDNTISIQIPKKSFRRLEGSVQRFSSC